MNEDRVLKTKHGQFEMRAWDGHNHSGIEPVADKVLVLVDTAMKKTKGGIHLTDDSSERQTLSSTTGILIAVGPLAFVWDSDRTTRWEGAKPEPGSRVCFERYAGQEYTGMDGEIYRVMQDRAIGGTQGMAVQESAAASISTYGITGLAPAA